MRVFISATRAAIFTSLSRSVSTWARRQGADDMRERLDAALADVKKAVR